MISFFQSPDNNRLFAVESSAAIHSENQEKLTWLFGNARLLPNSELTGFFVGPRQEMVSPWSTNAVEITQNMGIEGIRRIEEFSIVANENAEHDAMLEVLYQKLDQRIFTIEKQPEPILEIEDIAAYNQQEGLALSPEEVDYLEGLSKKLGRKLTDSEVFGFSQVNSEHCRHKIFNGTFIIDGEEKPHSLFKLIRQTSEANPQNLVSAYKDNVAFIEGPAATQFAPKTQHTSDFFTEKPINTVLSLKAETHNFPTTVEPFNGAATGSGGEIRDRMAGGKGSIPLAGTAVYMTSYSRLEAGRSWEAATEARKWLYQTPIDILIKASNGASDFGNKFGQPLICGSLLTFEHFEGGKKYGFDKVIMQAGGIGYARKQDAQKAKPDAGDAIVVMGGDNYRIGMGGGAVSSVATGEFANKIELNAIQRSNPEMQKRVCNAIRAMAETDENPIISIHDHGAGGHLNCLSELIEETGGTIEVSKLPVGDPTLSAKEIIGNESQERMGLVIKKKDLETLKLVAERERAPLYEVGETNSSMQFTFANGAAQSPINLQLADFFGKPPKTIMQDQTVKSAFAEVTYDVSKVEEYISQVLQLEAVASKDWLTNKVDRSVTGRVAQQQTVGELQLPLSNVSVMAIDFTSEKGMATSIGHAPVAGLVDPKAGSINAIAEALTNLVWADLTKGLNGVSLSANWMWPCKNEGEDARLYAAVEAVSQFAQALGINIPTGKDSLSMTQKYGKEKVYAPGTVIISTVAEVADIRKTIVPVASTKGGSVYYIDFSKDGFELGGSSFAQVVNKIGTKAPTVTDAAYFSKCFTAVQQLISQEAIIAGHDISAGGLVTALLEMTFPSQNVGMEIDLSGMEESDLVKLLFAEKPSVILQAKDDNAVEKLLNEAGVSFKKIGKVTASDSVNIQHGATHLSLSVTELRDTWMKTSYLLDRNQSGGKLAKARFENYKQQPLSYQFPKHFTGKLSDWGISRSRKNTSGIKAAIIREKGVNGDREMAYAMHLAGFDVKDVHMTDLISGREDLSEVNFIVFVGGFSNSDVLGSAKGWAGAFLYNPKAKAALDAFYAREDTLSLGVCNGCQLMIELGLITPDHTEKPKMLHNESHKFESIFLNMSIPKNDSVMLSSLAGSRLGVWVAHGEGKFSFPYSAEKYALCGTYSYSAYPGNPNGSDFNTAAIASADGRHLAMMPHLERSIFPWNWGHYDSERNDDEATPWIEAFVNARKWVEKKTEN